MDLQNKKSPIGTVRIWGCGGAGTNLAHQFYNAPTQEHFAEISTCFVDTSYSNLSGLEVLDEDIFVIPEKDGAGKIRRNIHQAVVNHLGEIMTRFEQRDFNIVVFSASGGSGSVIGPLVLAELVKKGQQAIGIVVGSHESRLTAANTFNTLKTLDNLARNEIKAPISILYHNNRDNTCKGEVDKAVAEQISEFSLLVSRRHHRLDTSDIKSWLRFDTHTQVTAQLALIDIIETTEEVEEIPYPIAIASLMAGNSAIGRVGADYFCDGQIAPEVRNVLGSDELHFVISVTQVPELVGMVEEELNKIIEHNSARPKQQPLVTANELAVSGLILE